VGLHHYPDIQALEDADVRSGVELRCLQLGQHLLKLRGAAAAAANVAAAGTAAAAATAGGDGSAEAGCAGVYGGDGLLNIQSVVQLTRDACGGWL
jgi:hypothetical protein